MTISHFKITQASLISALTFIVGQVVAFVPNLASDQQVLISAGTAVISAVFLIANSVHALASSKLSAKDLEGDVSAFVKSEVSKVDFNGIVTDVTSHGVKGLEAQVSAEVQAELRKILGTPPAPAPAPAAAIPQPVPPAVA